MSNPPAPPTDPVMVEINEQVHGLAPVTTLYQQPWRKYHTLGHVEKVVNRMFELAEGQPFNNLPAMVVAAIFHDIIYVPALPGCEEASAALVGSLGLGAKGTEAMRLIRLTADHSPAEDDRDGQILCDADLFELSIAETAEENQQKLFEEARAYFALQGHELTPWEWKQGRMSWIRDFLLEREHIYHTPYARRGTEETSMEHRARHNLWVELDRLEKGEIPIVSESGMSESGASAE